MTLKEAEVAARRAYPIVYDGVEYERIAAIGYKFDERRNRLPFIQLLDRSGRSVTDAVPERCKLKDEFFTLIE